MNEKDAMQEPQDESDPTSLNDDELNAASGGKAGSGDAIAIGPDVKDQGVIA